MRLARNRIGCCTCKCKVRALLQRVSSCTGIFEEPCPESRCKNILSMQSSVEQVHGKNIKVASRPRAEATLHLWATAKPSASFGPFRESTLSLSVRLGLSFSRPSRLDAHVYARSQVHVCIRVRQTLFARPRKRSLTVFEWRSSLASQLPVLLLYFSPIDHRIRHSGTLVRRKAGHRSNFALHLTAKLEYRTRPANRFDRYALSRFDTALRSTRSANSPSSSAPRRARTQTGAESTRRERPSTPSSHEPCRCWRTFGGARKGRLPTPPRRPRRTGVHNARAAPRRRFPW